MSTTTIKSTMAIVECDQKDCAHCEDGFCTSYWIRVESQECMTYEYEGGYDDEDD